MSTARTPTALAVLLLIPGLTSSQGLGAAAAREKARRKEAEKKPAAAKTYTQDDVLNLPPVENPAATETPGMAIVSAPSSSAGAPRVVTRESADAAGVGSRAQDEQRWRARAQAAQERIVKARAMVAFWEKQTLVPGYELVNRKSGAVVAGSIAELQAKTAAAKAELAAAEKALENLQDEARRASIPPGWLR
jgi:hypothetical protein